ncbi:MFS transporter [Micromonospora sp. WMMD812]|uniref:MFS transporter n=1 Tax=Micromonospora sp. WMMD812 TaxID=3015152 RepID=UPI00248CF800|nr:MFS transporter [Micromonospora sp. WMMD812]WBB68344.1 MFS transporter [Micromonospora sp. WMMD812]
MAFLSLMAFGTLPTPLWPIYQVRDHFGPLQVTIAFAAMVVGAAASFGALGHLSDRLGRRRIIAPALVVAIVSAVLLAVWPELPGLIVGRVLTGVAVGLMASTATVYLADLYREAYPQRRDATVPVLVSTVANLGGLALGPLLAGALAEWLPAPLVAPYLLFAAIMAILLLLVLFVPETVDRELSGDSLPHRFTLVPGRTAMFGAAAATGFFAFALMGLFSSLGAVMVRDELGITSTFVVGLAPFTAFAASAVAQLAFGTAPERHQLVTGTGLLPIGLAVTTSALYHPALWLFLTGAAIGGAGAGLLFKAAVTQIVMAADPPSRAGVLAVFFVVAYAGMGVPSVAFSYVIRHVALAPTMTGFGAVLSLGTLAAVVVARNAATPIQEIRVKETHHVSPSDT